MVDVEHTSLKFYMFIIFNINVSICYIYGSYAETLARAHVKNTIMVNIIRNAYIWIVSAVNGITKGFSILCHKDIFDVI